MTHYDITINIRVNDSISLIEDIPLFNDSKDLEKALPEILYKGLSNYFLDYTIHKTKVKDTNKALEVALIKKGVMK